MFYPRTIKKEANSLLNAMSIYLLPINGCLSSSIVAFYTFFCPSRSINICLYVCLFHLCIYVPTNYLSTYLSIFHLSIIYISSIYHLRTYYVCMYVCIIHLGITCLFIIYLWSIYLPTYLRHTHILPELLDSFPSLSSCIQSIIRSLCPATPTTVATWPWALLTPVWLALFPPCPSHIADRATFGKSQSLLKAPVPIFPSNRIKCRRVPESSRLPVDPAPCPCLQPHLFLLSLLSSLLPFPSPTHTHLPQALLIMQSI